MKNIAFAAILPLALLATPAMAQDADAGMGGFKVGAIAGIDSFRISDGTDSGSKSDIAYGVTVGYDFDAGDMVYGVEAEWADSGTGVTVTDVDVAGDRASLTAGRDLYIGARVGFKAGASSLVYVKGGYTDARLKLSYFDGTTTYSGSDSLGGWRAGVGFEQRLGPNFSMRGEYRYSDYGDYSYAGFNTGLSAQRHQGVIGLIGRF